MLESMFGEFLDVHFNYSNLHSKEFDPKISSTYENDSNVDHTCKICQPQIVKGNIWLSKLKFCCHKMFYMSKKIIILKILIKA